MRPFVRFLAFEAIGWLFGGALLAWLAQAELIPMWLSIVLFVGLVAKDIVLYPLTRSAYEHGTPHGAGELLGAHVRVERTLSPDGYVRAGSERWRARLAADGTASLGEGELARVRELRGLTLIVEPIGTSER